MVKSQRGEAGGAHGGTAAPLPRQELPVSGTDGGKMELLIEERISFLECLGSFVRTDRARGVQPGSVSHRILAACVRVPGLLSSVLITSWCLTIITFSNT